MPRKPQTHCKHGHPFEGDNVILSVRRNGRVSRQCRTCKEAHTATKRTGYFVAGHRDQRCPICGAGWFISASQHIALKHGISMPGLVSESFRMNRAVLLGELFERRPPHYRGFDCTPKGVGQRHRRWAAAVQRERSKGGDYIMRLAKLWKIERFAAKGRIDVLRREGRDLGVNPGRTLARCRKRGHDLTKEENVYVLKSGPNKGRRVCKLCVKERLAHASETSKL